MRNENDRDREEFQGGAMDMEAMEAAIAAAMATTEDAVEEVVIEEGLETVEETPQVAQEAPDTQDLPERELTLKDIVEVLTSMQTSIERLSTLFAGMVDVVKEVSGGMTELSAAGLGGGKDSGPVNPVVLKLAVQAAITAAIPELSKMLRGQIAAATVDLKQAAAEDARIVENNKKTVQEYTERRKNITQEV
ncbi:MAG: hypothetical protein A4E60_01950 [Syntrophorhabdus sp. PtaB.Bin047]|nr:MAG: hypothetical protein A4E60_01950 [Syntrophorhabdus sp. PtaB.Bin047]